MEAFYCINCNQEIAIPEMSEDLRKELLKERRSGFTLKAIQLVNKETDLDLLQSKIFIHHLNKEQGKCHSCGFQPLEVENVMCPNCRAFNINW